MPLPLILLPLFLHLRFPILLLSFLLLLFFFFLVFPFPSFFALFALVSFPLDSSFLLSSVFPTLISPALVSIAFYILLDTLLFLPPLFFSQSQSCSKQARAFPKLHSNFVLLSHLSLSSFYISSNKFLPPLYVLLVPPYLKSYLYFSHKLVFLFFFSLNPYFLTNSKLITSLITLLSNNASTITPSRISILSSTIFTVTSLNISSLFRLQQNVFTLESIANLLLLRPNQRLLDLSPYLNYFVHYYDCPHILLSFSGL